MIKIIRLKRNEEGQSLVEFALVLPILMVLILGMIEFGWILNGQITVTNAARQGARVAAISNNSTEASNAVQSALDVSSVTQETSPTINLTGGIATVTVNAQITPIVGFLPTTLVPNPFPLTATAVMRIEN